MSDVMFPRIGISKVYSILSPEAKSRPKLSGLVRPRIPVQDEDINKLIEEVEDHLGKIFGFARTKNPDRKCFDHGPWNDSKIIFKVTDHFGESSIMLELVLLVMSNGLL